MTSRSTASTDTTDQQAVEEVVIIGTGFVGLPLAIMLASKGKTVHGIDIDKNVVKAINDGTLNVNEKELNSRLKEDTVQENLVGQTEPTSGDAFVISVPTPLTEPNKSPDMSHVEAAVDSILPYLEEGDLVNVESTIPPLTCGNHIVPQLERAGYDPGDDIQLAHSPERILPGNVFEEIVTNDRIIGGIDRASAERAAKLYEPFLEAEIYYTDLVSAELCKLMENTYRDVNVALANEFALIGDQMDVNPDDIIELANKHPRVDLLRPGIGVGGHCLPVDPWFLNEVDPEHTNLITTARRINDMMPEITAKKIRRAVADHVDPKIIALGAAYKPNNYDQRNSPANEVVEELCLDGYRVTHYDRHIDGMGYDDLQATIASESADVVVQLVPHDETVEELDELDSWLSSNDVDLLQF
ncbi:nucleotide sugar dehydrogenase [Halorubrum salinarum]|uniref:UDP-N-acetyl-D-mannosamine dehydrogenase n=1 Tax=Halorubrum salinarum TaxID=2739057 RepID=A0A7D4BZW5_9EURY|nr:nucleotide sugar dehydrogenase [Halorubrum salinarum]QKG92036.1 nucleotide sugar dehydrogenase [Halorubrum salinarum]